MTRLWTVRIQDRFGDSGQAGIVSVELAGAEARLTDFVLSCRVTGRRVEDAMIFLATRFARQAGASRLSASYLPTERNKPTLMVLRQSGLRDIGGGEFDWNCSTEFPAPEGVTLLGLDEVRAEPGE